MFSRRLQGRGEGCRFFKIKKPALCCVTTTPTVGPTSLVDARFSHGVTTHPIWTAPELRSILVEQRQLEKPKKEDGAKGLCSGWWRKLQAECATASKAHSRPDDALAAGRQLRFRRYKGWMYQEVPSGYLDWVPKETKANPNAHNDLVRLATWGAAEIHEGLCQEAGLGGHESSPGSHKAKAEVITIDADMVEEMLED